MVGNAAVNAAATSLASTYAAPAREVASAFPSLAAELASIHARPKGLVETPANYNWGKKGAPLL